MWPELLPGGRAVLETRVRGLVGDDRGARCGRPADDQKSRRIYRRCAQSLESGSPLTAT